MFTHYKDDSKTFECYICKKNNFKNHRLLKLHLYQKHNKNRPKKIQCPICSRECAQIYLNIHIRNKHSENSKEKEKCSICDHWVIKMNMKTHMSKHSNPGVSCKICGKFLKSSLSLSAHMKYNHGEPGKFKCDTCDRRFHKRNKMMEHVAANHTREFLWKCRVPGCEREFRAEGGWRQHEKRYHPEEYDKIFKPFYKRNPNEPAPNIEEQLMLLQQARLNNDYEN